MLKTYEVKFKRFIDGKCYDGKERSARISAPSAYQAVFQHGQTNGVTFPEQDVEDIILDVIEVKSV